MPIYHCHAAGCRFKTRSFPMMAKHTRKKHPGRLRRHSKASAPVPSRRMRRKAVSAIPTGASEAGGIYHPPGCRCDGCK